MGNGKLAELAFPEHRLGVGNVAGARRRIAHVTDSTIALETAQDLFGEDLETQAHALVVLHFLAGVPHRDAGAFLAAVLEGVETEIGDTSDILARRKNAEHAASVTPVSALCRALNVARQTRTIVGSATRRIFIHSAITPAFLVVRFRLELLLKLL